MLHCICPFSEIRLLEGYVLYLVVKYTQTQFPQIPECLTLHLQHDLQNDVSLAATAKVLGSKKYCKNLKSQKKTCT